MIAQHMHGSRKFCQSVSNLTLTTFFNLFFLVDEGREDPNTTKCGSPSTHFAGGPMVFQYGLLAYGSFVILGDPNKYC